MAFYNSAIKCSIVGSHLVGGMAYKAQSTQLKRRKSFCLRRARVVIQHCYGVSAPIIDGKTAEGRFQHPNYLGTSAPNFVMEERTQTRIIYMKGQPSLLWWGTVRAVKPRRIVRPPSSKQAFFHSHNLKVYDLLHFQKKHPKKQEYHPRVKVVSSIQLYRKAIASCSTISSSLFEFVFQFADGLFQ